MKQPTLNVGRIEGGLNINSVPDRTRFDVDIRSAPNLQHATIRERLTTLLGESVTVSTLVDLPAVLSREDHAWIKQVYQRCQPLHAEPIAPRVVPYFTDASLLLPATGRSALYYSRPRRAVDGASNRRVLPAQPAGGGRTAIR